MNYFIKKTSIILIVILLAVDSKGQSIEDCSTCSKQLLRASQLEEKSMEELALLRNEIYARKGYVFQTPAYERYFETKNWYKPVSSNSMVKLTDIEMKNVDFLKSLETKIQQRRTAAVQDLKKLKKALNNNDQVVINSFLSAMKAEIPDFYESNISNLKNTLNKINLDDISWNKGRALYRVTTDNGWSISGAEIYIEGDKITLRTGLYGHSEIFGDFDDGYSDYMSEGEYAFWWIFEMRDNGIVYVRFDGAG